VITEAELLGFLQDQKSCHAQADGVVVTTDCLYPSNSAVRVEVVGDRLYTVSDRGGALDVLSAHGVEVKMPTKALRAYATPYGLDVTNSGLICAKNVQADLLPAAVTLVANASKDAATLVLEKNRVSSASRFKTDLERTLKSEASWELIEEYTCVGKSNKEHHFDYAIALPDRRFILIDAVSDDPASINSVVVSNLDVRHQKNPSFIQRIVYDDRVEWRSENILLLEEGAPTVAYTHAISEFKKIAA